PTYTADKNSPITFESYEMDINYYSNLHYMDDQQTTQLIINTLDGQARVTTMQFITSQLIRHRTHPTTQEILSTLRRTFGNSRSDNEILQEFMNFTRKSDETLLAYTKRFESMIARLDNTGLLNRLNDEIYIQNYMRGCKDNGFIEQLALVSVVNPRLIFKSLG
ncbi:MAG: hypothetical protein AAFU83_02575, partial [Bacteroidota bacterium]